MAIAFVNQAHGTANVSGASPTIVLTYTSSAGSTLVLYTGSNSLTQGVVSSVVDSNSGVWTQANTNSNTNCYGELWYIFNSPSITSVTVTFAGGGTLVGYVAGVSEFSGVSGVGASTKNTGNSNAPTITQSTTVNNDWIVAGVSIGAAAGVTLTTGNAEWVQTIAARALGCGVGDNTAASAGPVTVLFHGSVSGAWATTAIELKTPAVAPGTAPANSLMMVGCGI